MARSQSQPLPKTILLAAAALVAFSVVAILTGRIGEVGTVSLASSEPLVQRALKFEDRWDGGIDVIEEPEAEVIHVIEPGTNGFVRGVLRGFARHRKLEGMSHEPPFVLTAWTDGTMSLEDPLTGRKVPLDAFGPTNAEAFARLLRAGEEAT